MRLPVVPNISTKDGQSNKNARLTNCLKETTKRGDKAVIRPGLVLQAEGTGAGGGLVAFNNELVSVYGTTLGRASGEASDYAFTETTFPSSVNWGVTGFGGGLYIAHQLASDQAAYSNDGITWIPVTLPIDVDGSSCAYGSGTYCLVSDGSVTGNPGTMTSSDGAAWDYNHIPVFTYSGVVWDGTSFCAYSATDPQIATSADGVSWTDYTSTCTNFQMASGPGRIVGVGQDVGAGGATVSTDHGVTWTASVIDAVMTNWSSVAYMGGIYLATRGGFAVGIEYATSADGVSWTVRNFPLSRYWYIASSNSLFLAFSYLDDEILFSSDGIVWEEHVVPWANGVATAASDGFDFAVGAYPTADEAALLSATASLGSIASLATIATGLYDFAQSSI